MVKIGVASAAAVGLGAIIGAGIFVLSGTAIAVAGPYALIAFVLVGIVALIIAMVFGELGSIMPHSKGASYSYAYKAFGSEVAFITGVLLFAHYATAMTVIALGFGSYLASLLGASSFFPILFAIALILAVTIINLLGIRKAAQVDLGLVIVKIGILLAFVAFAALIASRAGGAVAANFSASGFQIGSIFAASVVIFFAYSGFQTIATFSSEVKGGSKSAAKAIMYAVVISIIVYALVAVSLLLLVPAHAYGIKPDPLAFALNAVNAPPMLVIVVDLGALIATASATLAMALSASRILYQISSDGLLPGILRKFDQKNGVAVNGVMLSAVISVIALFAGNIYVIASISNFGLIFSYIMACLALVHFRKVKKKAEVRMPLYPYLAVVAIVAMLAFMLGMPKETLVIGVVLVFSTIIIYYFLREVEDKKIVRVRLFK